MKHSSPMASAQAASDAQAAEKEMERLREMKHAFGPRFESIVEEYRTSLPGRLMAIQDAAELGAHETLAVVAHRLAGSSASLGALQVSALCRDLENQCSEGAVPPDWQARLEQISQACAAFGERLNTA